jgi:hypothetical protein
VHSAPHIGQIFTEPPYDLGHVLQNPFPQSLQMYADPIVGCSAQTSGFDEYETVGGTAAGRSDKPPTASANPTVSAAGASFANNPSTDGATAGDTSVVVTSTGIASPFAFALKKGTNAELFASIHRSAFTYFVVWLERTLADQAGSSAKGLINLPTYFSLPNLVAHTLSPRRSLRPHLPADLRTLLLSVDSIDYS